MIIIVLGVQPVWDLADRGPQRRNMISPFGRNQWNWHAFDFQRYDVFFACKYPFQITLWEKIVHRNFRQIASTNWVDILVWSFFYLDQVVNQCKRMTWRSHQLLWALDERFAFTCLTSLDSSSFRAKRILRITVKVFTFVLIKLTPYNYLTSFNYIKILVSLFVYAVIGFFFKQ